ncbi:hypothetical protein NP233_g12931 [Leucocoprinus birnbaumii]|uniref:Uncharacterized protein n=1 Tax=Leucocoprinus birnbaumii TaxID=56174 RepID=A0AAD5VDL1_9AGAR|nr:hypothetical protein NP233_g12931 [Leucocoprinus birnbaumii]
MTGARSSSEAVMTAFEALKPRDVPKLAGSGAGFVALIVILCLIIIISLTAILILLREDTGSDEEKNQRPKSSTYITPLEDEAGSQPSSWFHRTYQRLPFIRTGSTDRVPSIKFPRPQSLGEHPLSSSHDPHDESRDEVYLDIPQPRYLNRNPQLERLGLHIPTASTVPSVRRLSTTTTSMSSVRFETSGIREIYPYERDRWAPSPTATLPNIHTQMSSPTSTPASSPMTSPRRLRALSQEISSINLPASVREEDSVRNSVISTSPSPAPPTFEGGTKFLESL